MKRGRETIDGGRSSNLNQLLRFLKDNDDNDNDNDDDNEGAIDPSSPVLINIQRILQRRGTLVELLSPDYESLECISFLSDISLSSLLSVLYQCEIRGGNVLDFCSSNGIITGTSIYHNRTSTGTRKQKRGRGDSDFEDVEILREESIDTHTATAGTCTCTDRKKTNRRHHTYSVLHFTERVLLKRFPFLGKQRYGTEEDIIDNWLLRCKSGTEKTIESESKSKSESDSSVCTSMSTSMSADRFGINSHTSHWIFCMVFMMSYTAIKNRLESEHLFQKRGEGKSKSKSATDKSAAFAKAEKDDIISCALRLLLFWKDVDRKFGSILNCTAFRCFDDQLTEIDYFVQSMHKARIKKMESSTSEGTTMHNSMFLGDSGDAQKSDFDKLLEEMERSSDYSDEDEIITKNKDEKLNKQTILRPSNRNVQSLNSDTINPGRIDEDKAKSIDGLMVGREETTEDMKITEPTSEVPSSYETAALDLRPALLQLSKNAVSDDVNSVAGKIVTILEEAGNEDGVDGIQRTAKILRFGKGTSSQGVAFAFSEEGDKKVDGGSFCFYNDTLVSILCKSFVTEELSAARVSSFMLEFVLPSILALHPFKSRPASRILVTTLSLLVRDRPTECVNSLLIPTLLCHPATFAKYRDDSSTQEEPSKAQCELVSRLVKTCNIPTSDLSQLVIEAIDMKWTEHSIVVLTTCIQKKPAPTLPNSNINAFVSKIIAHSKQKDLAKNTKFAALFHALVTKYGAQVVHEANVNVDDLSQAASGLKSFLGKSIISTIKKLCK